MTSQEILRHIDHTLLTPCASLDELKILCAEALEYGMASVCIPPSSVSAVHRLCPKLNICTVIGFPLGYHTTGTKLAETEEALRDGASEIDMVINLTCVKNGDMGAVSEEIAWLKEAVGQRVLKVIVETCYLTREEKILLCRAVTEAGADYIKTSTGFGTAGAAMEDILLFQEHIGPGVKIKAAGGIRTWEDLVAFLKAGCSRIGTSSALKALSGDTVTGY